MKEIHIKKRCERCEKIYTIQNIKQSAARELLLEYTPCTNCGFVKEPCNKTKNKSGRCIVCSIPFFIVDHHGLGMCKRCNMDALRAKQKGNSSVRDFLNWLRR